MEKKVIALWASDETVTLTYFPPCSSGGAPAILVLPGGGYNTCAPFEGEPVAQRFAEMGYQAYVLRYSTRFTTFENMGGMLNLHTIFPEPLQQVAAAIRQIRNEHPEIPVVIAGFSAGGHLASCYGNLWNNHEVGDGSDVLRPNAIILGYAATELTQDEIIMKAIYGEKKTYSDEEIHRYMARELIGTQTPPTFLFHSVTDPMVPARESVDYAQSLEQAGIPYELHLFGTGGHAYAIADGKPMGTWVSMADAFVRNIITNPLDYDKEESIRLARVRMNRHGPGIRR